MSDPEELFLQADVEEEHVAGRGWYERAYLNGERTGAHNLGIDFRNAGDFTNAILWLRRAAAMDDGDAWVDLAELLLDKEEKTSR